MQKQRRVFSRELFLQKTPYQESGQVSNTFCKIVVRKLPIYLSFLAKFVAGGPNLAKNKAWIVPETLCSLLWCVFNFQELGQTSEILFSAKIVND